MKTSTTRNHLAEKTWHTCRSPVLRAIIFHPSGFLPRVRLQRSPMAIRPNASILCSFDGVAVRRQNRVFDETVLSFSIVIAVLSPTTVMGNALIVAVIWRNRTLRTPFYMFLGGLALTDLSTGFITQPFYVASKFICSDGPEKIEGHQAFLLSARVITSGFGNYFMFESILILTCMSIERWLQMKRRFLVTQHRARFVAGVILAPIPVSVFRALNILTGSYKHVWTVTVALLLLCVIAISTSYLKVFRIIRCHQRQVQAKETPQISSQAAINLAKYKKTVFTILYTVLLFYISYAPFIVFYGIYRSLTSHPVVELVYIMSLISAFLSSALNPVIYLWRIRDIRNGLKQLVRSKIVKIL